MRPSFLSQIISGFLILYAIILLYQNFSSIQLDSTKLLIIILLFSVAMSLHGIQHAFEETYHNFNPFEGKWGDDEKKKNEKIFLLNM